MKGTKTYIFTVEIDEGYDEFWEDVAKGKARTKVKDELISCLADHGFFKPDCRVRLDDVLTMTRTK